MTYIPLIDPNDVENFRRTEREKEAFFLFTIFVAGKTAKVIAGKAHLFHKDLIEYQKKHNPEYVESDEVGVLKRLDLIPIDVIHSSLKRNKIGKYTTLNKLFTQLQEYPIDINNTKVAEIEALPGIGKKTSRYFMLYTFANLPDMAILDRHVLTYLRNLGYDTPKNTPSGKQYDEIEKLFLFVYKNISNFKGTLTEFDLAIWKNKGYLLGNENID